MLPTITVFSAMAIDRKEFHQFLIDLGAIVQPDNVTDGEWIREYQQLWIYMANDLIPVFQADDPEEYVQIERLLGARIRTYITFDVTQSPGSDIFAAEFAWRVCQRWPIIAFDQADVRYDCAAIASMIHQGKGFNLSTTDTSAEASTT